RFREQVLDLDGRRAGQLGADRDRGVGNVGQQVHVQPRQGHDPEQRDGDRAHGHGHAPLRGDLDQSMHGATPGGDQSDAAVLSPATASVVPAALITLTRDPSLSPAWPTSTKRSWSERPSRTSIWPPFVYPVRTTLRCAVPSSTT